MSTLKVSNIQDISNNAAMSISGGVVTATNAVRAPGAVLQVVQGGRTSRTTVNATTFTDIGVSASITPTSTTSKILVTVSGMLSNSTNNGYYSLLKLFRDSTEIGSGTGGTVTNTFVAHLNAGSYETNPFSQQHLDSPNSTSAITYNLKLAAQSGSVAVVGGRGDNAAHSVPTTITLMEIGG